MEKIAEAKLSDVYDLQDYKNAMLAVKTQMDNWYETLEENAKDHEKYSKGLMLGYRQAMNTFDLHFGKFSM